MSTNEERREAAKRKLEERLERERQVARRRKVIIASVSTVVVVAIVATATTLIVKKILDDREAARWASCSYEDQPSRFSELPKEVPAEVPANQRAQAQQYLDEMRAGEAKQRTSPKPGDRQLKEGTVDLTLGTNRGAIPITLDRNGSPCNTGAIATLAENGFYNGTNCHRLTNSQTLKVLQCGDPTATGAGGPGWSSPDELPTDLKPAGQADPMSGTAPVLYPRGTIAIANSNNPQSGQSNTGSSQFFVVLQDSQLAPNYTVVGKVDEKGFGVLDSIQKAGLTPGPGGSAEDGRPKEPVDITTATVSGNED
ncbi:peptidylprolyl isomerase [Gordonia soli]|uniref:Putative peptidyl-prolyl cis-trans isomerase n=1 Tax=Gordonia soli NBRC 108243 TaxID=1223545 RepID=M0QJV1_9ACTN|nr:peptidylprolyl isomerase [Gordonia soli]GAC68828.1 putative peptidyl-prolyl cis-trans isomerase [Gordonia soli NBRC 108243]